MLVFLAGAGERDGQLLSAAVAVELLHMATLVHDDVLDRAPVRRGRPTVYASAGPPGGHRHRRPSLLPGVRRAGLHRQRAGGAALSGASSALARGELMQRADAWNAEVAAGRYLERCRLKTASLFGASCRLGALLGGAPEDAEALADFGERIGLAFQLLDDVLDVSGPVERTGKPRGTDLLDGTVTLPLILARERDPGLRDLDLRASVRDAAAAEAVCERITLTGSLDEVRRQALAHVGAAKDGLAALGLAEDRERALSLVADGVVQRYA